MARLLVSACILLMALVRAACCRAYSEELMTEELLIEPAPGRNLLTFKFQITAPHKRHYQILPLAVHQLSSTVAFLDFQVAFTRGKWHQEAWQSRQRVVRPAGAELQATFPPQLFPPALLQAWGNLTHSLSGLFCASLNFLSHPHAFSTRSLLPHALPPSSAHHPTVLYATLPKEAACTENLTPWTRLLPCRSQAGVARLLHPYLVASAVYMSMEVALTKEAAGLKLDLQLTAMVPTSAPGPSVPYDLPTLLSTSLSGPCPLSSTAQIYVHLPGCSCATYRDLHLDLGHCLLACPPPAPAAPLAPAPARPPTCNMVASFPPEPPSADPILSLLYYFQHIKAVAPPSRTDAPVGMGALAASLQLPPDLAAAAAGGGRQMAAEWVSVSSRGLHGKLVLQLDLGGAGGAGAGAGAGEEQADEGQLVCLYQTIPWYIRAWLHTLQLTIDGEDAPLPAHLRLQRVTPAQDRRTPLTLDLCMSLPPSATHATLSIAYTKSFLTIFEYAPDAHRGFDLPAVLVWRPPHGLAGGGSGSGESCAAGSGGQQEGAWKLDSCGGAPAGGPTPLLEGLTHPAVEQVYAAGLIIPEASPDFSMPYNVCCLTSTVLAIFVGATLKLLLEGSGPKEPVGAAPRGKLRQLARAAVVVGVVVGVIMFVDEGARESFMEAVGLGEEVPDAH